MADFSPYSKQGISEMLDLKKLGLLFDQAKTDPAAKAAVQALGPGFSQEQAGPKKEDILGGFQLPEAREVGPQGPLPSEGETGESFNISGVDEQRKGPDWGNILSIANIGFTDLAKAISNHPEAYGGAMYDLNKGKLQQEQIQKLRARQSMWEESYKASQNLPPEVLSAPEFAELAQAKQALDKDAADGAIDNEKNVTNFNMALTRAKHGILSKQQAQEDELKLSSLSRLGEGAQEQGLQQRQRLEALASDPSNPLARAAAAELSKMQLSDVQTRNVGGQDVRQTGEAWGAYDLKRPDIEADRALKEKGMGLQYAYRQDMLQDKDQARRGSFLNRSLENAITRRLPGDKMEWTPELTSQAEQLALKELAPRMLEMARAAGVRVVTPDESGALNQFEINGQTFSDPESAIRYLLSILS